MILYLHYQSEMQRNLQIGASGLLHMLTHSYLYAAAGDRPMILQQAYKAAFFVMLVQHCVATGVYCKTKSQLLSRIDGIDKEILSVGLDASQRWQVTTRNARAMPHYCIGAALFCKRHVTIIVQSRGLRNYG